MITEGNDKSLSKKTKGTPKPPDGGWGWWVVAASFLIHIVADGVAYTFGLFFVYIAQDFQETKSATSWITSIMAGITYGSGPIAGAVVNKFGCRVTSIIGSFVAAFGFAISYYAQSVTYLYVSIGLIGGLGLGLIYLPAIISVSTYFEKRRAFATGIAVCGSGFGTTLLAPIIEFLLEVSSPPPVQLCAQGDVSSPPPESSVLPFAEVRLSNSPPVKGVEKPLITSPSDADDSDYPGSPQSAVVPLEKQCVSVQYLKPAQSETLTMSCSQPVLRGMIGSIDSFHGLGLDPSRKRHSLRVSSKGIDQNQNSHDVMPGLIDQRKDIFYSGSIIKLPEASGADHHGSSRTLDHLAIKPLRGDRKTCCGCCPEQIKSAFLSMTDFSILKDPIFLFFAISNFATSIGYNVPYIYLVDLAIGNDSKNPIHSMVDASFLLSIVGFTNTVSRVVLGYLSDKAWMNRLYLYIGALTACGLATAVAPHVVMDLNALRICAGTFGATVGVYVGLTSVILADLLGIEKLTNAFGLLLLFQGVATVIGPPIVGVLCDHFKDYKYGFGLAGGMIAISGLMLLFIPLLKKGNCGETSSQSTDQQALSSGKQSDLYVDMDGTTKPNGVSNGFYNGTVKVTNNNLHNV